MGDGFSSAQSVCAELVAFFAQHGPVFKRSPQDLGYLCL